jgi:hypothetical protein
LKEWRENAPEETKGGMKKIGEIWKGLTEEERGEWKTKFETYKAEFIEKYPAIPWIKPVIRKEVEHRKEEAEEPSPDEDAEAAPAAEAVKEGEQSKQLDVYDPSKWDSAEYLREALTVLAHNKPRASS